MDNRQLQVIYEDNHLIAVNKPRGVLVQGDITEDRPLCEYVKDYIKWRYQKPGMYSWGSSTASTGRFPG